MTSGNVEKPTAIYAAMYPATVLLPGGVQRSRCKVFAAPEGLFVYFAMPNFGSDGSDWSARVDWPSTGRMPQGYMARVGWDVHTEAGLVTVTSEGGCGCGWP